MRKILIFLSIIVIVSCSNEKKNEYESGRIDLERGFNNKTLVHLSEIAEDIEYIFLETNDSCLMAEIRKIVYDPPFYFIMDRLEKSIFIFNEEGKYVNKISAFGQGPHEYTMIYSFDAYDNILYIYDYNQRKILKYEVSGRFIGTFKIEERASSLKIINENNILFAIKNGEITSNEGYVFSQYDKDFNLKMKFKQMAHNGSEVSYVAHSFYRQRDMLVYWEFNIFDTIYNILPEGHTEARFILDPGRIPSSVIKRIEDAGKIEYEKFQIARLVETDDYVFIFGIYKRTSAPMIYYKNENQTIGVDFSLINDIDGGTYFWPSFKFNHNKVCSSLLPEDIKKYLKMEMINYHRNFNYVSYRPKIDYDVEKHKKLLDQLEKTDEMSNPILMIVTMKSSKNHEN